jgi:hypothetical protein
MITPSSLNYSCRVVLHSFFYTTIGITVIIKIEYSSLLKPYFYRLCVAEAFFTSQSTLKTVHGKLISGTRSSSGASA